MMLWDFKVQISVELSNNAYMKMISTSTCICIYLPAKTDFEKMMYTFYTTCHTVWWKKLCNIVFNIPGKSPPSNLFSQAWIWFFKKRAESTKFHETTFITRTQSAVTLTSDQRWLIRGGGQYTCRCQANSRYMYVENLVVLHYTHAHMHIQLTCDSSGHPLHAECIHWEFGGTILLLSYCTKL